MELFITHSIKMKLSLDVNEIFEGVKSIDKIENVEKVRVKIVGRVAIAVSATAITNPCVFRGRKIFL